MFVCFVRCWSKIFSKNFGHHNFASFFEFWQNFVAKILENFVSQRVIFGDHQSQKWPVRKRTTTPIIYQGQGSSTKVFPTKNRPEVFQCQKSTHIFRPEKTIKESRGTHSFKQFDFPQENFQEGSVRTRASEMDAKIPKAPKSQRQGRKKGAKYKGRKGEQFQAGKSPKIQKNPGEPKSEAKSRARRPTDQPKAKRSFQYTSAPKNERGGKVGFSIDKFLLFLKMFLHRAGGTGLADRGRTRFVACLFVCLFFTVVALLPRWLFYC